MSGVTAFYLRRILMDNEEKKELIETILQSCLFSEYLPSEFSTAQLSYEEFSIPQTAELLPPVNFSMDKFNDSENRRFLAIPDVRAYIAAVQSLEGRDILEKLIDLNAKDVHSLSKFLNKENKIKRFSDGYLDKIITTGRVLSETSDKDFLKNLNIKLEKSKACKYILHLDIANFYNSIYAHNIATLTQGEEWANAEYQKFSHRSAGIRPSEEYRALKTIDDKIIGMNLKRTHGLLIGPRLSFIIAESLLTQIDIELEKQLSACGVDFVRYVDDYDVFIKEDEQIKTVRDVFNTVLQKYGLLINDSKTKIEGFPFYTYIDYADAIKEESDLYHQYAKFGQIEKNREQNGALLYFCENILSKDKSSALALSLLFSILRNVSKALMSSCKNIAGFGLTAENRPQIEKLLIDCLTEFTESNLDLESVWVLYTLLKLFPNAEIPTDCKLREIALVVYLYESEREERIERIIEKSEECGWLLNYELFFSGHITEDKLKANLHISDITYYKELKSRGIHFYIKSE